MYSKLSQTFAALSTENILEERKTDLQLLIDYIQEKKKQNEPILLNFICTHNSRRSHLSQIWAQTAANFYQISEIFSYSGGTDATELFPKIIEAIAIQGFEIEKISSDSNAVYAIKFAENCAPIIGFSKVYNHFFNPKRNYMAIMTCSSAEQGCPLVIGAEKRMALKYEDPKISDGSLEQNKVYFQRSLEIATEMKYIFSKIKK